MKQEDTPTAIQTVQVDMAVLLKLQEKYDLAVAENARLKAAMDKYSEDEMLLIERCAKICEQVEVEAWAAYKRRVPLPHHEGMADGAANCATAIRALKGGPG